MNAIPQPSASDNTSKYISLFLFLLLGLIPFYWFNHKAAFLSTPAAIHTDDAIPGISDWFLAIKMPEAPYSDREMNLYKDRMSLWIAALVREGFHPMLLTDVYARINHARGLPDKTIVLIFEPGYGQTYKMVSPILERYKVPSVWITNLAAVKRMNRRFVSEHQLWRMRRSGFWDIGFYDNPATLTLQSRNFGSITLNGTGTSSVWSTAPVSHALNQGKSTNWGNRLKANILWDDRELISRLLNEVPVRGVSQLTVRQTQDRVWGVSNPGTAFTTDLVTLQAPLDKRAISVSWLGTAGLRDFDLQLDVAAVSGELWLLIHSDREKGESIRIGFTPDGIMLEKETRLGRERLMSTYSDVIRKKGRFTASVHVEASHLSVLLNGNSVIETNGLSPIISKRAMLELMVYNRIRGTASAQGMRLIFNPHLEENRLEHS